MRGNFARLCGVLEEIQNPDASKELSEQIEEPIAVEEEIVLIGEPVAVEADLCVICYETGEFTPLKHVLNSKPGSTVANPYLLML